MKLYTSLFAMLVLLLSTSQCAHATDATVSAGETLVHGPGALALDVMATQPSNILRGSYWYEGVTVIGAGQFHERAYKTDVAVRAGLMVPVTGKLDLGLGIAALAHPLPFDNASGLDFNPQAVYHINQRLTVTYTHFSDAGIRLPNLGRDVLLIGWRL